METIDPAAFEKDLARNKEDLARIRKVLDEQRDMLESIKAEFDKLGVDTSKLPPIDQLPKEYQEEFLNFSRELKEIDDILAPPRPKAKAPKIGRRMTI